MTLGLVALLAVGATMLGGLVALRLRDQLHLVLGFSAGAVVAVAFFDLLPESFALTQGAARSVLEVCALGFLSYLLLDRVLRMHSHAGDDTNQHTHGTAGAGTLSLHSLLDGVGIGLAFKVSPAVGLVVTVAVLAHDFSDGINTVNYIVRHGGKRAAALRWLAIDALAPAVGIASAYLFAVPQVLLGYLLALFAGFFLYIGASDLIPESHHAHPTFWTTFTTLAGAVVLFVVVSIAG